MSKKPMPGMDVDPLRDPAEPDAAIAERVDEQALPDPAFAPQMAQQMDHKPSSV